ncbi:hypothetical protein BO78DRAFT_414711 [Aspergillus sclerotiicarbonarius CBS 121057]|uniref:Uncharacterized protein n=1 Tax=Aspergillus sclerotiicarbonarius (strain CBS 121057 / IBT 28362) TaxID=1448318 RepID=A0A319EK41_ASPSB|nr:hypothetical protein BO78DRAFT_414711 [Aspergillus sclerotiicarbonarius CBS 121057]
MSETIFAFIKPWFLTTSSTSGAGDDKEENTDLVCPVNCTASQSWNSLTRTALSCHLNGQQTTDSYLCGFSYNGYKLEPMPFNTSVGFHLISAVSTQSRAWNFNCNNKYPTQQLIYENTHRVESETDHILGKGESSVTSTLQSNSGVDTDKQKRYEPDYTNDDTAVTSFIACPTIYWRLVKTTINGQSEALFHRLNQQIMRHFGLDAS